MKYALGVVMAAVMATSAGAASLVPSKGTLVIIPGSVTQEVANDEAVISFYAMKSDKDLNVATRALLTHVQDAMAALRAQNLPVEFETQGLSSSPQYTQRTDKQAPRLDAWQVRQTISAKLKDVDAAARVTQAVAQYFAFNGIQFQLSASAVQATQTALTQEAVRLVTDKADVTAKALGCERDCVKIEQLDFGSISNRYGRVYDNAVMMKSARGGAEPMPMPVLDPGTTTVTQSVTAHVRIR